jgi:teichuronic acid biosynthesis glycosyltransferase TuaC
LLYVGNLIATKGIGELCHALSALEGDKLVCVFVGEGPMLCVVEGTPHAIYAGRVENEVVRQYMAAADALVLPSYTEGLPTVVVEAGSMGLPVIATAVGGSAELLANERGVLVPPRNVPALIEALRIVVRNDGALLPMARRLQRHVREQHDIHINTARLLGIYEDAAAEFTSVAWNGSSQSCANELVGVGD